ncbi:MAG: hypothetical protein B6244_09985 [Candidatus Cloacimonetes bacterium 4572_55]|nr:MAG: hypothetical protein B6244_09985 [Candidatus Cloacimonetes bacterium 4572_55]
MFKYSRLHPFFTYFLTGLIAICAAPASGDDCDSDPGTLIPTNESIQITSQNVTYSDGTLAPAGSVIRAYDPDGTFCGADTLSSEGGFFFLFVYKDDNYTPDEDEGALPGDTLSFTINGWPADDWEPGTGGIPGFVLHGIWDANGSIHDIDLTMRSFLANHSPALDQNDVGLSTAIELDLVDYCPDSSIDPASIQLTINEEGIPSDDLIITSQDDIAHLLYTPPVPFPAETTIRVCVQATSGETIVRECYEFVTGEDMQDITPPAMAVDFVATDTTFHTASLRWIATGDDGYDGDATEYDVRYATSPISTQAQFNAAQQVMDLPTPSPSGSPDSVTVSGLHPNRTYYFAIQVIDEAGNRSPIATTNIPTWPRWNIALFKPVVASSQLDGPASFAVDGDYDTDWNAGTDDLPHEITIAFQGLAHIDSVAFKINHDSDGYTLHNVSIIDGENESTLVHTFSGQTAQGNWLTYAFDPFLTGAAQINVETTQSPSSASWFEIEVFGYIYAVGDTIPPARIEDLAVTGRPDSMSVILSWTAPGDDSTYGRADEYDLRYSDSLILTELDFYNATRFLIDPPDTAGTIETATITGLECGAYYFSIRTHDEAPNLSEISPPILSPYDPCNPIDLIPPATISDLTPIRATSVSMTLSWTAPGDDGYDGQATEYDLRYSAQPITSLNFDDATQVETQPIPGASGSIAEYSIEDLDPETLYYFAIKTADEVPNWSMISNLPYAYTPDPIPPDPICDLRPFEVTSDSVRLTWIAPGDDGTDGDVTGYDMRYSTGPITASNFHLATQWPNPPSPPQPAGEREFLTITGLEDSTWYWFAIQAYDGLGASFFNYSDFCAAGVCSAYTQLTRHLVIESTSDDAEEVYLSGPGFDGVLLWASDFQPQRSWTEYGFIPDSLYVLSIRVSDIGGPSGAHLTSVSDPLSGEVVFNTQGDGTWLYDYAYPGAEWNHLSFNDSGWESEQIIAPYGYGYSPITGWQDPSAQWVWSMPIDHSQVWVRREFSVTQSSFDTTPPSQIIDLTATAITSNHVELTWTAPGDNGRFGRASVYEIRYATFPLNNGNFESGMTFVNPPEPAWGGAPESVVIDGLQSNTIYNFAIRTADEIPNWSAVSVNDTAWTNLPADVTVPNQITDLDTTNIGAQFITLTWTAPTDTTIYGNSQAVSTYQIYYADNLPLDETNYMLGELIENPFTPSAPDMQETYAIAGLQSDTRYYFVIFSLDHVNNRSEISNTAMGQTRVLFQPDNLCLNKPATVSANDWSSALAVDGDPYTQWNSEAYFTQWVEIDLRGSATIDSIALKVAQNPSGQTIHHIYTIHGNGDVTLSHIFSPTRSYDGLFLTHGFPVPLTSVKKLRVETVHSPAPVAWYEIQAFGVIDTNNIAPAAISDMRVNLTGNTYIDLAWTAPGADANQGRAFVYDARYSISPITAENFAEAQSASNEPTPQSAGSSENFSIGGLDPDTRYYFAVKTADEQYNWSPISNVVDALTASEQNPCVIDQDICESTIWYPYSCDVYLIQEDVSICNGATLTIQPGVYIRIADNKKMTIRENGALQAYGSATLPIRMEASVSQWGGLIFENPASSSLNYTQFRNIQGSAVSLQNGNLLTISDCTFENISNGYAVYLENASPVITDNILRAPIYASDSRSNPTIMHNEFIGRDDYPITVGAMTQFSSGETYDETEANDFTDWLSYRYIRLWGTDIIQDVSLPDELPYYVQGDLTVYNDALLTIHPGVTLRWVANAGLIIGNDLNNSYGALYAVGALDQIQLRGDPQNSQSRWAGVRFTQYTTSSSLGYCQIEQAYQSLLVAGAYHPTVISVERTENVTILNCTVTPDPGVSSILLDHSSIRIEGNTLGGAIYGADHTASPSIVSNSFSGSGIDPITMGAMGYLNANSFNNWSGGIRIWATEIDQNTNWTAPQNLPYKVLGDIVVKNNAEWIIDSGVHIYWASGSALQVGDPDAARESGGTLQVHGVSSSRCLMTCDPTNSNLFWSGIEFTASATDSWVNHTDIQQAYSAFNGQFCSISVNQADDTQFNDVMIEPVGEAHALALNQSSCTIRNSTLYGRVYCLESSGAPLIQNNTFIGSGTAPIVMGAMANLGGSNNFIGWQNGIYIQVWGTVINRDAVWYAVAGLPYYVKASLIVGSHKNFAMQPNVQVMWEDDAALFVGNRADETPGSLTIDGPAYFTSFDDDLSVSWRGLYFTEHTDNSTVDQLVMTGAKNPVGNERFAAVRFSGSDLATLSDCVINYAEETYPIYLDQSSPVINSCTLRSDTLYAVCASTGESNPVLMDNIFIGHGDFPFQVGAMSTVSPNNYAQWVGEKGIKFLGTHIDRFLNWANLEQEIGPYYIFGDIECSSELSISAGAEILLDDHVSLRMTNGGSLQAIGSGILTADQHIGFTSIDTMSGTWGGIHFSETSGLSRMAYCLIEFGGDVYPYASLYINSDDVTIEHCDIVRSFGNGIYVQQASPTIHSVISSFHSGYGISHLAGSSDFITHCNAYDNNSGDFNGLNDPVGHANFSADPRFVDFGGGDYHLMSDSPCIGTGQNNSSVGIFQYIDAEPPDPILTLTVVSSTSSSALLSWIATGDDSIFGRAAEYDLRYRMNEEITLDNFATSDSDLSVSIPSGAGVNETHEVDGLQSDQTYYFALKVIDDANNISEISNVVSVFTGDNEDDTAPATITNLTVTSHTDNSAALQWTAPGDDGNQGQASLYDCRFSTSQINQNNFYNANPVSGMPTPAPAGVSQAVTVHGLQPNTTYYFAIRSRDEAIWSNVSNNATVTTDPYYPTLRASITPNFGDVMLESSIIHAMQLCNAGAEPLVIDSFTSSDSNFEIDTPLINLTLQPGQCYTAYIAFAPTVLGYDSSIITIISNDPESPTTTLEVNGFGILQGDPTIVVENPYHNFGHIPINGTESWTFTIHNSSSVNLVITSIAPNLGVYQITSPTSFPRTVPAEGDLSVTVRFRPVEFQLYSDQIAIASNDPDLPSMTVDVVGFGYDVTPYLRYTPSSHDYGSVAMGGTSEFTFDIRNHESATGQLSVTLSAVNSGFSIVGVEPEGSLQNRLLDPGQHIYVTVRFSPTDPGSYSGSLSIQSNDTENSSVSLALTGYAPVPPEPILIVSQTAIDFGTVYIGESAEAILTLSNYGNAQLEISSLSLSGSGSFVYHVKSPTLFPQLIDTGQSIDVVLEFTPTQEIQYTTSLSIGNNDLDLDNFPVDLMGRGIPIPPPEIQLNPPSYQYDFGPVAGEVEWSFLVENICDSGVQSVGPLIIYDININGDSAFDLIHPVDFPQTVQPCEVMQVYVRFTPTQNMETTANLTIISNDFDESSITILLRGERAAPEIDFSAISYDFGSVKVGQTRGWTLVIYSVGNVPITVQNIQLVSAGFGITSMPEPGFEIIDGGSQPIVVTFSPTSAGDFAGTVFISSSAENIPEQQIDLVGRGTIPDIDISEDAHNFGSVVLGQYETWEFDIENQGQADLIIENIVSDHAIFEVMGWGRDAGSARLERDSQYMTRSNQIRETNIPAGGSLGITVRFVPTEREDYLSHITVMSDDPDEPTITLSVQGQGIAPIMSVLSDSLNFGHVSVDSSRVLELIVFNYGDAPLILSNPVLSDDDFRFGSDVIFPVIIEPEDQSAYIPVYFIPIDRGLYVGSVTMGTNLPDGSGLNVSLTGEGIAPELTVNQTSLNFGQIEIPGSESRQLTLENTGTSSLIFNEFLIENPAFEINSITRTRVNSEFDLFLFPTKQRNPGRDEKIRELPDTLGVGEQIDLTVTFTPTSHGTYHAPLTISSNALLHPIILVNMSGIGLAPDIAVSDTTYEFGQVEVAQTESWFFAIRNSGNDTLHVNEIGIDSEFFTLSDHDFPMHIPPIDSVLVTVYFTPVETQEYSCELVILSDDPDQEEIAIYLSGVGVSPDIYLPVMAYDFGDSGFAMWDMPIHNIGNAALRIYDVISTDDRFLVVNPPTDMIAPQDSVFVQIIFDPDPGDSIVVGAILITSNDPDTPEAQVALRGESAVGVELNSFTAEADIGQVILTWELGAHSTPTLFAIYRSEDELTAEQVRLAQKPMLGNSSQFVYLDKDIEGGTTYYYWLKLTDIDGSETKFGPVHATPTALPAEIRLNQNYPNPFLAQGTTRIRYEVPTSVSVTLKIYNIDGRLVKTLVDQAVSAGFHVESWDGKNEEGIQVAGGAYFYQLRVGDKKQTRRMTLLR